MTKVFISYSHDSSGHCDRVAALVQQFRELGIPTVLDTDKLPGGPDEGWPAWSERQVVENEKVLVVCTRRYRESYDANEPLERGMGAACEAGAIRQIIYDNSGINPKFRVVLFEQGDIDSIPINLKRYHRYEVWRAESLAELIAWLKPITATEPAVPASIRWPTLNGGYMRGIANRDKQFECFEQMLQGLCDERALLLRAESSRGKSALMHDFHKFSHANDIAHCFIDLKGGRSVEEVLDEIAADDDHGLLSGFIAASGSAQRQTELWRALQSLQEPLILAFDTYEAAGEEFANWLECRLLGRIDRYPALRIVIAGQRIPSPAKTVWESYAANFELPPIKDEQHWYEFGRRHYAHVPEETLNGFVSGLVLAADGNPSMIGNMLERLAAQFADKEAAYERP